MTAVGQPLLIVNADDYGRDREATDQTLRMFSAGRVTSATAMVFMEDSQRAGARALEADMPVGLHVNLTDPLTGLAVPLSVRLRHQRACAHFAGYRYRARSWTLDPRIRRDIEAAVSDQLDRFVEIYGRMPSHIDGHKHVHVCPGVALASSLHPITRRRNALWSWPGTRTPMGLARALRRALTYGAFTTTRDLISIHELFQANSMPSERRLCAAATASVEVMAHPGFSHERQALASDRWERLLDDMPLGSYADLGRSG